ncbi:LamG-like jellyroll fold domain-containing protein [Myxococcota bacterium]
MCHSGHTVRVCILGAAAVWLACPLEEVESNVTRLNRAPLAEDDDFVVGTGLSLVVDAASGVLANDVDRDGDELQASLVVAPAHGDVTLQSTGAFIYTPEEDFLGIDRFTYEVSDAQDTDTASARLDVVVLNAAPQAVLNASRTSGPAHFTVDFDGSQSSDADGSIVAYAWNFGDGDTDAGENVQHTYALPGNHEARLTVTDDLGATGEDMVTIEVGEAVPTVAAWAARDQVPNGTWMISAWDSRSFRVLIAGRHIVTGGSAVAIRLNARGTDEYTLHRVSLAKRVGDTLDADDSSFTEVTFGGSWEDGVVVEPFCPRVSDPIPFDLTVGEDVFVTFWAQTPTVYLDTSSQSSTWTVDNDHTSTIDWEELTLTDTSTHVYVAEMIAVVGSTGRAEPMMLGHWSLDEVNGARSDASGRGNDLAEFGTIGSGAGRRDLAAAFDGTSHLSLDDASQTGLDVTYNLTVAAYFRADDVSGLHTIVAKYDSTGADQRAYRVKVDGGGLVASLSGDGITNLALIGTTPIEPNRWYHVALVVDSCTQTATLYLDGALEVTETVAFPVLHDATVPFTVGAKTDGTAATNFFVGLIDEVRVYATALSQNEVQGLLY